MRNCIKCSAELDEKARFCSICGADNGLPNTNENSANAKPEKSKKSKTGAIAICALAAIILVLIGVVLYLALGDKGDDSSSDDSSKEEIVSVDPYTLSGEYISESGLYRIKFKTDGTCKWYQDNTFFNGTYTYEDDIYYLEIEATSIYISTVFEAVPDGDDLIITGGVVYGECFEKQ